MRSASTVLSAVLLAGFFCTTTGCHAWRTQSAPLPSVLERRPTQLKVRTGETSVVLHAPALVRDTLTGFTGPHHAGRAQVAAADVRSVATRHSSPLRIVLLIAGIWAAAAISQEFGGGYFDQ